jgi:hypothetical protein
MPNTIEDKKKDERERQRKEQDDDTAGELEPVSVDDLDDRTERARRRGESGE